MLTTEQRELVENHYLVAMDIMNKYWTKNTTLLNNKKISREDLEQIALTKLCESALRADTLDCKFVTYLYGTLHYEINREVYGYNMVKIPRPEYWDSDLHKNNKAQFATILHGVVELDKPIESEFGESAMIDVLESQVSSEKVDDFKELIDAFLIRDVVSSYFDKATADMLILYIEDYTLKQISEKIDMRKTTLVYRLYKAKDELKQHIIKDGLFGYNEAHYN